MPGEKLRDWRWSFCDNNASQLGLPTRFCFCSSLLQLLTIFLFLLLLTALQLTSFSLAAFAFVAVLRLCSRPFWHH
ncbi:hypothetical protein CPB84DRAFT_1823932 [Gymnopilus junonius]|uniref:Uncharacterized protein n=1 Tax=Gymnopilus junonius TaxID=109634 RepID=A0A9P5NR99_GYMJU|nr:hypothetical protein CPB84DRAFT_1823932 [Gymnopilus junonius]